MSWHLVCFSLHYFLQISICFNDQQNFNVFIIDKYHSIVNLYSILSFMCSWTPRMTLYLPKQNSTKMNMEIQISFNMISNLLGLFPAVKLLNRVVLLKNKNICTFFTPTPLIYIPSSHVKAPVFHSLAVSSIFFLL